MAMFRRALLGAVPCLALSCLAAPAVAQVASPPVRSVDLVKVVLDTQTVPIKGKLRGGTLCISNGDIDARLTKEIKTQDHERFDALFATRMKAAGFAVDAAAQDMFARARDRARADYLIGATMRPDTINLCSSMKGQKGDMTIAVEWQLYDRAAQKVVATATTTGTAQQALFAGHGLFDMWNDAFVASLDALIARDVLQPYLGRPAPPKPSPAG